MTVGVTTKNNGSLHFFTCCIRFALSQTFPTLTINFQKKNAVSQHVNHIYYGSISHSESKSINLLMLAYIIFFLEKWWSKIEIFDIGQN
jgi:hypothetical protein